MKPNYSEKNQDKRKKILKTLIVSSFLAVTFFILFVIFVYFVVTQLHKDLVYKTYANLPKTDAVLILGAKVESDGRLSDMLKDRADVAIEIYKNKIAEKILVSGDHGTKGYDEVNAIKKYLLEQDVKPSDIFLDHAGFNTYDSIYRAKSIFQVNSMIISTQNFHLPRALYIARALKISAYGISADRRSYGDITYNYLREIPADVKAFGEVNLHIKPKYLGPMIPIDGDGQKSWD